MNVPIHTCKHKKRAKTSEQEMFQCFFERQQRNTKEKKKI